MIVYFAFFKTIVKQLVINYFQCGLSSLETCCHLMDCQWAELEPGKTLLLPLLDNILQVRIPIRADKPFSSSDLIRFRSIVDETTTTTSVNSNNYRSLKFPIDDNIDIDKLSRKFIESRSKFKCLAFFKTKFLDLDIKL